MGQLERMSELDPSVVHRSLHFWGHRIAGRGGGGRGQIGKGGQEDVKGEKGQEEWRYGDGPGAFRARKGIRG